MKLSGSFQDIRKTGCVIFASESRGDTCPKISTITFNENDFDVIFASWVFDDSADISSLFHSAEIGAWKNNFGGYTNPRIDSLIVESKLTLDHEKRRTINRKLHAMLAEEAPYTFLWTLTNYAAYHKKVRRVAIHPYKFFSFADDWFIPSGEQK